MYQESSNEFATEIAHIARDLLAQPTMQETLNRITELAVETVPGCDHAGILLVRPGFRVETTAATSQLVVDSNEAQGASGEGPWFDPAWRDETYRIAHMAEERRWPRYVLTARELGIGSMMGFQLFADEESLGALNLYSERPYGLTVESEQKAWILASHAGIALKGARQHRRDKEALRSEPGTVETDTDPGR